MPDAYSKDNLLHPFGRRPWLDIISASPTDVSNQAIKGIIAGSIAGGCECFLTYPTDYVKTRLQLDGSKQYNGIIDCVKKTVKSDGVLGLYRGLNILLLGSVPRAATRFGTFETIRSLLVNNDDHLDLKSKIICGLCVGFFESVLFTIPIETINIKLISYKQNKNGNSFGFIQGIRSIIKNEGIFGIYQGVTPTLIKQSFTQVVRFYLFETVKDIYVNNANKNNKNVTRSHTIPKHVVGAIGLFGGFIPVIINNPLDVIKTRMQSDKNSEYRSSSEIVKSIWKIEGYRGFYKGTAARLIHVCSGVAITLVIYESIMEWFDTLFVL